VAFSEKSLYRPILNLSQVSIISGSLKIIVIVVVLDIVVVGTVELGSCISEHVRDCLNSERTKLKCIFSSSIDSLYFQNV